jgi:hypothetical protein
MYIGTHSIQEPWPSGIVFQEKLFAHHSICKTLPELLDSSHQGTHSAVWLPRPVVTLLLHVYSAPLFAFVMFLEHLLFNVYGLSTSYQHKLSSLAEALL